jgi:cytochrome c oxidase assembly protein Cox11
MVIAEPVLSFAQVPMYGLICLYTGVLVSAWIRGQETGRIERIQSVLRIQ